MHLRHCQAQVLTAQAQAGQHMTHPPSSQALRLARLRLQQSPPAPPPLPYHCRYMPCLPGCKLFSTLWGLKKLFSSSCSKRLWHNTLLMSSQ